MRCARKFKKKSSFTPRPYPSDAIQIAVVGTDIDEDLPVVNGKIQPVLLEPYKLEQRILLKRIDMAPAPW